MQPRDVDAIAAVMYLFGAAITVISMVYGTEASHWPALLFAMGGACQSARLAIRR